MTEVGFQEGIGRLSRSICVSTAGEASMPYYSFDLVVDEEMKHQGSLILENLDVASDRAEQLANELCLVLPELKKKGCAVRVADSDNNELYRTPLVPIPTWMQPRL